MQIRIFERRQVGTQDLAAFAMKLENVEYLPEPRALSRVRLGAHGFLPILAAFLQSNVCDYAFSTIVLNWDQSSMGRMLIYSLVRGHPSAEISPHFLSKDSI